MRIGILGSGLMGGKLGTIFARAGHQVVFSYARNIGKLERIARQAGDNARAGTPSEAVEASDALLLAVHWSRVNDVLKQAGDLSGKVIVSCVLPTKGNIGLVVGRTSSGAELLARKLGKGRLVAAFGTVPSEVFFDVFKARRRTRRRPSLMHCGGDRKARKVAVRLIRDAGFEPVDAGPLRIARYLEPFALAMAQLAYESGKGPEIAYRIERFNARTEV
jgi:predicted dinucleotide-binding enzyme